MRLDPGRKIRTSDFFLAFEKELHVAVQLTARNEVLEGLDVHEELSLVIVRSSAPDGSVVDFRLKRVAVPLLQRLHRLNVVVSVHQHRICLGINDFLPEDHRMSHSLAYACFIGTGLDEQVRQGFCTKIHICLMLFPGTDGRNSQDAEKLLEEPFLIFIDVLFHIVFQCGS